MSAERKITTLKRKKKTVEENYYEPALPEIDLKPLKRKFSKAWPSAGKCRWISWENVSLTLIPVNSTFCPILLQTEMLLFRHNYMHVKWIIAWPNQTINSNVKMTIREYILIKELKKFNWFNYQIKAAKAFELFPSFNLPCQWMWLRKIEKFRYPLGYRSFSIFMHFLWFVILWWIGINIEKKRQCTLSQKGWRKCFVSVCHWI